VPATSNSPEVYVSDSGSGAPPGPAGSFAVTDAARLGLSALAGVVAGAQDGIGVLDDDGRNFSLRQPTSSRV
jgi:hypothetical protein